MPPIARATGLHKNGAPFEEEIYPDQENEEVENNRGTRPSISGPDLRAFIAGKLIRNNGGQLYKGRRRSALNRVSVRSNPLIGSADADLARRFSTNQIESRSQGIL